MSAVSFTPAAGGSGPHLLSATAGPDLGAHGYAETEYTAAGIARSFAATGSGPVTVTGSAPFVTRVLVRRPIQAAAFSGCVVAEWLNVSSGSDAAPEYTYLADELVRAGHAWVGVSAQYTGVAGGVDSVDLPSTATAGVDAGPGNGLIAADPDRYHGLSHPGDGFCYDIFGHIGTALHDTDTRSTDTVRDGGPSGVPHPLAGLPVRHVIAAGESQAAMALTTYVNRISQLHNAFDGALIHSRAVGQLSLSTPAPGGTAGPVDIASAYHGDPVVIGDGLIPAVIVQTETEVLGDFDYVRARQPDSDRVRVWEVAGTAHADRYQIGPYEDLLGCPAPVNRGQQRFVVRAALHHLSAWIDGGTAPPAAAPLTVDMSARPPRYVVDEIGNVRGGVRTPCVDAPASVLSGIVDTPGVSRICVLFGSTTPAAPEALARRYRGPDDYLAHYRAATDAAIDAGFVLAADREELLADADPDAIPRPSATVTQRDVEK